MHGVCLNLPARVDAAEDVCRALVWLSLPAAVGGRGWVPAGVAAGVDACVPAGG